MYLVLIPIVIYIYFRGSVCQYNLILIQCMCDLYLFSLGLHNFSWGLNTNKNIRYAASVHVNQPQNMMPNGGCFTLFQSILGLSLLITFHHSNFQVLAYL